MFDVPLIVLNQLFSNQMKKDGLVVSAFDFQAGHRGFESHSGRDNFQTTSTHSSYSTCPGLSTRGQGALGDRQRHQVRMGNP